MEQERVKAPIKLLFSRLCHARAIFSNVFACSGLEKRKRAVLGKEKGFSGTNAHVVCLQALK